MKSQPNNHIPTHTCRNVLILLFFVCLTACESINLGSQYTAIYILNTSKIVGNGSQYFFSVGVLGESRTIINKSLVQLSGSSLNGLKRIQIFNYELTTLTILLTIQNSLGHTIPLSSILVQSTIQEPNFQHGILMMKSNINDYMLPFNLISQKWKHVVVDESHFENRNVSYDYQPFLDTFWNQHGTDAILLSWLPYFSRCSYKNSGRISLQDLLNPWNSNDFDLGHIGRLCNTTQSWFWGSSLECLDKKIVTECVLEQLQVKKTKKQVWWQNKDHTIFYIIKAALMNGSLLALDTQKTLTGFTEEYYNNLIPLIYETEFDSGSEIPNKFVLHFKIASINDIKQLEILRVELVASKMGDSEAAANPGVQDGEALLVIEVQYLSNFQTLTEYGKDTLAYFLIYLIAMIMIVVLIKFLAALCKANLHFILVLKLILFPAIKGLLLAFLICSTFLGIFLVITSQTNFAAISVNFDNTSTGSNNWKSYTGRVGLTIFFVGYFLLSTGIAQSFKVLTPEQTKIILQDDLMQKRIPTPSINSDQSQQVSDKHNFIINNMNSHRKYLVSFMMGYIFLLLLLYYAQIGFKLSSKILFVLFGYPAIHKVTIIVYRNYVVKQLLYLSALLITLQPFLDVMMIGDMFIWGTVLFYFAKLVSEGLLTLMLEIGGEWVSGRVWGFLRECQQTNAEPSKLYRFLNVFRSEFSSVVTESRYQKSIYYTNLLSLRFAAILTRPFLIMLILITIKYNFICQDFQLTSQQLIKTFTILVCFIPFDTILMLFGIKFFETKFGLEIFKCLEFNKFKFNHRKARWINDCFAQNKSVQYFYQQFQKFCFSSQMYLLIFIISFSLLTLMLGFKIIIEVSYVAFIDPAMLLILAVVWLVGNLSSIATSFVAIKLKVYDKKEDGKMRAKLENVERILRKTDFSEYFQTESVKNYFLFYCKEWIVQNITKIFDKQDFIQNNYEFLFKYKHYKSLLKKKKIEQRKQEQKKSQEMLYKKLSQEQKDKKIVIRLPRKQFNQLAKPLVLSWLYIAKQFVFLKSFISHLKQAYKKQNCELCSMNIELEVIEKISFATLVNEYRLMNVGRMFIPDHFVQFYKQKQECITLCIECKDKKLYLEKKHLDLAGAPKRMLSKWLIMARSRLLHRRRQRWEN